MLKISQNVTLYPNGFGNPNWQLVRLLLLRVSSNFQTWLRRTPSHIPMLIFHTEDTPLCSAYSGGHMVFLATEGSEYYRWVYQFAHEFCHHTIGGTLSGENGGIVWFEETICELSSWCNLAEISDFCLRSGEDTLAGIGVRLQSGLHELIRAGEQSRDAYIGNQQGIRHLLPYLCAEPLNRDMNRGIAFLLYPIFQENNSLWKVIGSIGDCRQWQSLEDFLDSARTDSDPSYRGSLDKLCSLLLP